MLLFLMGASLAHAEIPTRGIAYSAVNLATGGGPAVTDTTLSGVCVKQAASWGTRNGFTLTNTGHSPDGSNGFCYATARSIETGAESPYNSGEWARTAIGCPANSVPAGSACQCAQGYEEDSTHTQCVPGQSELEQFCQGHAASKNAFKMTGSAPIAQPMPETSCYLPEPPFEGPDAKRGCVANMRESVAVPSEDGTTKNWSATGVFSGATCSTEPADPEEPPAKDDPCPGGFQGTVNGEQRCVPAEPDKGIEGVKESSSTDAEGTKRDVKETTKCEGGKCTTTTTTTTTTASGSTSTSTTTQTSTLAEKCVKDPANELCKKTQGGTGKGVGQLNCQQNASAEGCGGEGAGIGDLYQKKEKTVEQVLTKAANDLKQSPLGSSVSGFFNVSGGGSCPTASGVIPFLDKTITIDVWCSQFAAAILAIVRGVVLMLAAWMAFRIAIDH